MFLDVSGESFKIFVRRPFLPHIKGVHQSVVAYGGNGFFGRVIVDELLSFLVGS